MMEAIPGGRRAAARGEGGVGAAWDEAYRLRRDTGAERVEPIARGGPERVGCRGRATFRWSRRPGAARQAGRGGGHRVEPQAHRRPTRPGTRFTRTGHGDGEEGKSVIVGHPDTGYREHREFWDPDEARSPSLLQAWLRLPRRRRQPARRAGHGRPHPEPGPRHEERQRDREPQGQTVGGRTAERVRHRGSARARTSCLSACTARLFTSTQGGSRRPSSRPPGPTAPR